MRIVSTLFIVLFAISFLNSQKIEGAQFPAQSDSLINIWLKENSIPALGIGVISNFKIKQIKVHGNLTEGKVAPYNSIFKVASLTKPILSMVTLELINKGQLNLDDKLHKHWIDPDISTNPHLKSLTIRHILTHQTGFKNWRRLNKSGKLEFDFPPGTRFQYSGEGYEYLRRYLERRFGATIEELANTILFQPLGMRDTKFSWAETIDISRYAINHDKDGKAIPTLKNMDANGADHLLSTIEDYCKFAVYVLKGGFLSEELALEMTTIQVEVNEDSSFGLGWEIVPNFVNDDPVIMHSGSDPGAKSLVVLNPLSGKGVVIFTNSDNGGWQYWSDIVRLNIM